MYTSSQMQKELTLLIKFYSTYMSIFAVSVASGWQYFTSLSDLTLSSSVPDPVAIHSDYIYGECQGRGIKFQAHIHLDHLDVLGKIIVRGWLDINRIPTCILLRARSYPVDTFRSTAYNFQMCVPRITYCHSQKRFKFFYYEWYIPPDMVGGMNWDIYFYGPESLVWQ